MRYLKIIFVLLFAVFNHSSIGQETAGDTIKFIPESDSRIEENSDRKSLTITIKDSYSRSSVTGSSTIGALIGRSKGANTVANCYATGLVFGYQEVTGGLLAEAADDVSFQNSYWDIESTELNASIGGEGRSKSDMSYPYPDGTYSNWDFTDIWTPDVSGINNGYPYLYNQMPLLPTLQVEPEEETQGIALGSGKFAAYTHVRLIAVPFDGNIFQYWYNEQSHDILSMDTSFIYTMQAVDSRILASFEKALYTLNVAINPPGSGSVAGQGNFAGGDSISLTATPNQGYVFENWTNTNGTLLSTENPYSFLMPNHPVDIVAVFSEITSVNEIGIADLKLYPNPFNDVLHVENTISAETLTILNMQGQIINNFKLLPGNNQILLRDLQSGIYLARFVTKYGSLDKKLIKL